MGILTSFCSILFQYDSRFGDAFWNSGKESMIRHIYNIMTSWALVAEVWYLPPMHRLVNYTFNLLEYLIVSSTHTRMHTHTRTHTRFGVLNRNHPVRISVQISCKPNSSWLHELILMALYTVAVYNVRMCMKENSSGLKYLKGDYLTYSV